MKRSIKFFGEWGGGVAKGKNFKEIRAGGAELLKKIFSGQGSNWWEVPVRC